MGAAWWHDQHGITVLEVVLRRLPAPPPPPPPLPRKTMGACLGSFLTAVLL